MELLQRNIVDNLGVPLLHDSLRAIVEVVAVFAAVSVKFLVVLIPNDFFTSNTTTQFIS